MHIAQPYACFSGDCQTLSCLEEMRCVAPLNPAPSFDDCYDENIQATFDSAANVSCDAGYFIHGFEQFEASGSCGQIYCLETLNCCRFDTSQVALYDDSNVLHSWILDFDQGSAEGWVLVDTDEFICGLWRANSSSDGLDMLEGAWTRRLELVTSSPTPNPTHTPTSFVLSMLLLTTDKNPVIRQPHPARRATIRRWRRA